MSFIIKQFNIGKKLTIFALESKKLVMANGFNWKDVDDVKTVYTPIFGVPEVTSYIILPLISIHHSVLL